MEFTVEYKQEEVGHWLAEAKEIPGVLTNGKDPYDAVAIRVVEPVREHDIVFRIVGNTPEPHPA